MAAVAPKIVRGQIALVKKTVGKGHLSWSTKQYIAAMERDLETGREVTQQELYQLMENMKSDLRFKENT